MAQFYQKRRRFKFQQLGTHDFHWIFFYQLHQRKAGKRFQETDWEWIAFKKAKSFKWQWPLPHHSSSWIESTHLHQDLDDRFKIKKRTCLKPSSFHSSSSVWPDWGIYWTLGNFLKPLAAINLPKSPTFLGNFCKGVKIYHFLVKSILCNFYRHLAIFFWSHCSQAPFRSSS